MKPHFLLPFIGLLAINSFASETLTIKAGDIATGKNSTVWFGTYDQDQSVFRDLGNRSIRIDFPFKGHECFANLEGVVTDMLTPASTWRIDEMVCKKKDGSYMIGTAPGTIDPNTVRTSGGTAELLDSNVTVFKVAFKNPKIVFIRDDVLGKK